VKSSIDVDLFALAWYANEDIDVDRIEDPKLKDLYIKYLAQEEDLADLYEEIGDYLNGSRSRVLEAGDAYVNERPDDSRPKLPN
jgi:hypothetical protein